MIICLLSVEIEHAMDYDYQQPDLFWCKLKCPNTQWWHSTACMSERHVSSTAGQKATRVWCYHYSMEAPHHVACCMDMRSQEQCTRSLGHLSSGVQSSSCFKCVRLSKILQAKLYPKHMALGYGLENCNPITTNLLMLLASDCITILCLYVAVADCTIVELMAKKMPCSPPAGLAIFLFLDSTLHSTAARIYTTEWRVSIAATPGGGCGCYGYPQSASPSPISTHFTPPPCHCRGGGVVLSHAPIWCALFRISSIQAWRLSDRPGWRFLAAPGSTQLQARWVLAHCALAVRVCALPMVSCPEVIWHGV